MGEQAVALARAVDYESAGTVEFVVSGATKEFYFLEMNTRLQVEHPVTELITGVDLVELMIRVAYGEKLPLSQADVGINGWAMECRINAEDPFRGFLPSTGRLVKFQPPADIPGQVRVDTGVYDGGEISMYYDSMIAKLIVHGATRDQAIARMRDALNSFVIRGISSNIPFQAALMQHPVFHSGVFDTGFIPRHYPKGFDASMVPHDDPALLVSVAAFVYRSFTDRSASITGQLQGHERKVSDKWMVIRLKGDQKEQHPVLARPIAGGYHVEYKGEKYELLSSWQLGESLFRGTCNGEEFTLQVERHKTKYSLFHWGARADFMVMSARAAELLSLMPEKPAPDLSKFLMSPMPGLLREVAVKVGQDVKAGEKLAVIEAMKMENILKAEQDCKVKKISAAAGESLSVDQIIVEFE
jgi:propionyl-CoA carboxylase alpha chain